MRLITSLFLCLLFAAQVGAIQLSTQDDRSLTGLLATVTIGEERSTHVIGPDNALEIEGDGEVTIQVVDSEIYVGHHLLGSGDLVLLRPTARISGRVVDSQDNLLQHKPLRILCSGDTPAGLPMQTDELGFFMVEEVGFGVCDITVIVDDRAQTERVNATESKHYIVTLRVEEPLPSLAWLAWLLLSAFLVAAVVVLFILRQKSHASFTGRQEDLLATLNERERQVVQFLFHEGSLTHSQIRHKTGWPKSSLSRALSALMRKDIVIDIDDAGTRKYELSERFRR